MRQLVVKTPLGPMVLIAGENGLRELISSPPKEMLQQVTTADPLLLEAERQLAAYFSGDLRTFDLPLDFTGLNPFATAVLGQLQQVPYASTLSYGELATRCGSPQAARAVGRVMAGNPWPVIVPCHRVVAANGGLGGYSGAGGSIGKRWLLDFERRVAGG